MSNDEHDKRQWLHWLRQAIDKQNVTEVMADTDQSTESTGD